MSRRRAHPTRSVLFLQSDPAFRADAQVHAAIARHLPALGIEVTAACEPAADGSSTTLRVFSAIPGIDVLPARFGPRPADRSPATVVKAIAIGGPATLVSVARLAWFVQRRRIGNVHCTEKARETIIGYLVARLGGARLVVHLHVKVEPWFSRPTRWVMRHADRLLAISEFVGDSAVAMGYRREAVRVALNGMSPPDELAGPADEDRASVRSEFGLAGDAPLVAIVARLNPWKGHAALLDAVSRLGRDDVTLLVVGDDGTPGVDGVQGTELRAQAGALGIADRVHFTGHRSDARRLIHASDVFAMPSEEEPFGLVYIEAMAAGIPVLAVANGGVPEVVLDGETGLLSARGDTDALTANLRRLLDDPALRTRLGGAGRRRVQERFGAERMAADVAAVYSEA